MVGTSNCPFLKWPLDREAASYNLVNIWVYGNITSYNRSTHWVYKPTNITERPHHIVQR